MGGDDVKEERPVEKEVFIIEHGYIERFYSRTTDAVADAVGAVARMIEVEAVSKSNFGEYDSAHSDVKGAYETCKAADDEFLGLMSLSKPENKSDLSRYIRGISEAVSDNLLFVSAILRYIKVQEKHMVQKRDPK